MIRPTRRLPEPPGHHDERDEPLAGAYETLIDIDREVHLLTEGRATPDLVYAIERTYAAWLRVTIWVFSIGILGMNANQFLAAADIETRFTAPVFLAGLGLAATAVALVPVHLHSYVARSRLYDPERTIGSRRCIHLTTALLIAVMAFSLGGSAWFGAAEVVEVA